MMKSNADGRGTPLPFGNRADPGHCRDSNDSRPGGTHSEPMAVGR